MMGRSEKESAKERSAFSARLLFLKKRRTRINPGRKNARKTSQAEMREEKNPFLLKKRRRRKMSA